MLVSYISFSFIINFEVPLVFLNLNLKYLEVKFDVIFCSLLLSYWTNIFTQKKLCIVLCS